MLTGTEVLYVQDRAATLRTTAVGNPGEPDIKRFNVKAVNDYISENMAILAPEEKYAFIAYADKNGGHGAIVGRITHIGGKKIPGKLQWTVMGNVTFDGAVEASAAVRWSS